MVQAKDFDSEGNYIGAEKREHSCPIDNCGEVQLLLVENKRLNGKIKSVAITSLSVLSLIVTVLLFMSTYTLNAAKDTMEVAKANSLAMNNFAKEHNAILLRDAEVHATLINQMQQTQAQLQTVAGIQLEVIQEVSIMKNSRVR